QQAGAQDEARADRPGQGHGEELETAELNRAAAMHAQKPGTPGFCFLVTSRRLRTTAKTQRNDSPIRSPRVVVVRGQQERAFEERNSPWYVSCK
ncbi:MAG TPA: hypothetical protein VF460_06515, partial [Burkholderiales bacterium]